MNGVSPNGNGIVLRYDTQGTCTNLASWLAYDASVAGRLNATIFKGAVFDGRFVFFVPYLNSGACVVLRYDTQTSFTNASAWCAFNAINTSGLQTDGYDGAVFDGRYIYFAPYHNTNAFSGLVLRFDARLLPFIPPTVTGGLNL